MKLRASGDSSRATVAVPDTKMHNDRLQLKGIVRRRGFTLLELLVVMSIIILLASILLPCLLRAKENAYELFAMKTQVDKEGKVMMRITDPSRRKRYDDIYMIEIYPPKNCHWFIKKPYPWGMKRRRRDRQDYIKWRPNWEDIGIHAITVVYEAEEVFEQEIKVYVYNKELLEAERAGESDAD